MVMMIYQLVIDLSNQINVVIPQPLDSRIDEVVGYEI